VKRKTLDVAPGATPFGHQRLDVFRISRQLAIDLFRETGKFPSEERFGLTSQIRRSAVSIPANIAEGAARRSKREFSRFLLTARGSSTELHLLLEIAHETGILGSETFAGYESTVTRIFSMINGLIRHSDAAQ
jgi:four helix bundle protein